MIDTYPAIQGRGREKEGDAHIYPVLPHAVITLKRNPGLILYSFACSALPRQTLGPVKTEWRREFYTVITLTTCYANKQQNSSQNP